MSDDLAKRHEHWCISVETSGELIVAISSERLAGRELSPVDEVTVFYAINHLLSFMGLPAAHSMMERIRELESRPATAEADALSPPLTIEDRERICDSAYRQFRKHQRGIRGQMTTEWDGIESWVASETHRYLINRSLKPKADE